MAPEPRDKLDATTRLAVTGVADGRAVVNGPEGEPPDWDAADWRQAEEDVRRLRQRGRGRAGMVHPDRGGLSPGRGDQPRAAECGLARHGAGRRGPLPHVRR